MRRALTVDAAGQSGLRAHLRERHIAAAREARAEVERRQGVHPTVTVVDGVRGRPEEAVRERGIIVYLFDSVRRVAEIALAELRFVAPEDTGLFRKSFVVLVDGTEAPPETAGAGSTIAIIDRQPYSRRLEHGWSLQAPDGIFEVTAAKLRRERPDVIVKFDYLFVPELRGKSKRADGRTPAILLKSAVF